MSLVNKYIGMLLAGLDYGGRLLQLLPDVPSEKILRKHSMSDWANHIPRAKSLQARGNKQAIVNYFLSSIDSIG